MNLIALNVDGATGGRGDGGSFFGGVSISGLCKVGAPGEPNMVLPIYAGYNKTNFGNGGLPPFSESTFGKGEVVSGSGANSMFNDGTSGLQPVGGGGGENRSNNSGGNG